MSRIYSYFIWAFISLAGACSLAFVALNRGEKINALWIITSAVCIYLIAYRYYSKYIANKVLQLDPTRVTPAHKNHDGLDYVPTNKSVLLGHHFAAIAGAGPLVGPVLAAQIGYLPGMIWILAGVVFAGAVQDCIVLFVSTRRDGRSIGEIIRKEMGVFPGFVALFGTFMIMIIIIAVLALIVVKALYKSPWGTFSVLATIPIALFMGIYTRYIRVGKVGEIAVIGFILMMLAIIIGGKIAENETIAPFFTLDGKQLTLMLIIYGLISAHLPVWLLLAPRDYLCTFLKIGTIAGLAIGIAITMPTLQMPSISKFIDGSGPVWSGSLFPFLFITIACGAVSGFHALIASGTTPKMVDNEKDIRMIGYGAMLMESFVAIVALTAACVIDPGVYFSMNSSTAVLGGDTVYAAAQTVSSWGFEITPETLSTFAEKVGETSIISRAGGAPTLAIGMSQILSDLFKNEGMMAFWYHFAILFEALFILTAVDAGTRSGRFMLQDLLASFIPQFKEKNSQFNITAATILCIGAWGYFLYQGVTDPLGGINTLWPLFGIANQMLATIALVLCTTVLFKMKREQFAWVTLIPATFLLICTGTAALEKIFHSNPKVGFLALANKYKTALAQNELLAPAKSVNEMKTLIFNNQLDAALTALFLFVMFTILFYGIKTSLIALKKTEISAQETPYEAFPVK